MQIEIEDLEAGDEILIGAGSSLKYLKVLRTPQLKGKNGYYDNKPLYKTVKCSLHKTETTHSYVDYTGSTRTYTKSSIICTPEDHNTTIYQDLNYKTIWLVKKASI